MAKAQSAAALIDLYNAGREPERLALKRAAMRSNVFSFFRGSAHLYWQRAAEAAIDASAPVAWCSGDLHLENFGTYLADNGLAYFDINDFDEAAKAPCDWEVVRLLSSIAVAGPSLQLTKTEAKALMLAAADAYLKAIKTGKALWIERRTTTGAIGDLFEALKSRGQVRLLDKRTILSKGRRRLDVPSDKMLPVTAGDRALLKAFAPTLAKAIAMPTELPDYFEFIDAGRRIAGTGSLGVARFVVLTEGAGSPDSNVLLDLKAATPSSLAIRTAAKQPKWPSEADRIVDIQRRCQALAPHLLHAVTFQRQPFVVKELQPSADRLDLARIGRQKNALQPVIETMARLAAWAQLRAAGRDGTATPDALIDYAADVGSSGPAARLVDAARALAATTTDDFADFCTAYDQSIASDRDA
jgi:uncharacterized protein (DUF2252 family)